MQGRGFIEAGSLLVEDKLVSINDEDLIVENYHMELTDEPVVDTQKRGGTALWYSIFSVPCRFYSR